MYYAMYEMALGLESWNLNSVVERFVGLVASGPTDFIKSRFRECETIRNGIRNDFPLASPLNIRSWQI